MPRKKNTAITAEILTVENAEDVKGINTPKEEENAKISEYYPKTTYTGTSLVEALRNEGLDTSYGFRGELYKANGYTNYLGLGRDNKILLDLLKEGKLKRVK